MFKKETYVNRRARLKKDVGSGILLFLGNNEVGMNYLDNTFPYYQDASFNYFFGLKQANLTSIIDIDEDREIIFGNELTIDDIVWMGTLPTIDHNASLVGVKETAPTEKLAEYLKKAQKQGRKIHFLPPYRAEHNVTILNLLGIAPQDQEKAVSLDFIKAVVAQRNHKSAEEILEIEDACNITADMHIAAMKAARPGMIEAEVAAAAHRVAIAADGELSFPIIATINGQTLHNHNHSNVIKEGQMLLIDCGALNKNGYSGDMSSTFPVGHKFTTRQREIYEIALAAHNNAIDMLRPGTKFVDVHKHACSTIFDGLKALGLTKGDTHEAVEQGAHALFFPCGLGHMMGMDVHDMENLGEVWVGYDGKPKSTVFGYKSLRLARELEPGFVLTIEPGIYFIPELIDKWRAEKKFTEFLNYDAIEKYKGFSGCRNEEDFLITPEGSRLLGKPIPKSVEDVEKLRQF
ncbi:MAG: aminopeptidase P family protein [Rikenellaceae bacterium]